MIIIAGAGPKQAGTPLSTVDALVDAWVDMWNHRDLSGVARLFADDDSLTYFSSEKHGVLRGLEEVRLHHEHRGFVPGGKPNDTRMWLEEMTVTEMEDTAVVSAIWFLRYTSDEDYRGPVTFVCRRAGDGWRFAHLNFGSYV